MLSHNGSGAWTLPPPSTRRVLTSELVLIPSFEWRKLRSRSYGEKDFSWARLNPQPGHLQSFMFSDVCSLVGTEKLGQRMLPSDILPGLANELKFFK